MAVASIGSTVVDRLDDLLGGRERRQVIATLACVLALDSADKATIGASATQLESGLGISKTQIGLLLSISSLVGALASVPFGILVDRARRTRMLAIGILLWSVAMLLSGLASGYVFLLLTRVGLGAVTAVAAPAVASLIGDFFREQERSRIYGFVLSGELIGAGFGFLVSGQVATISWRVPFFVLVAPSLLVWWFVRRLDEPARGGAGRLAAPRTGKDDGDAKRSGTLAQEMAESTGASPRPEAVLDRSPADMPVRDVLRYVLRVRTNIVLIVASALGYFFFSGLRGFAIQFVEDHYGVSQHAAPAFALLIGVGSLGGVLAGGRLADRLLRGGRIAARVEVPGVAVLAAAVLFAPALITTSLWAAVPLLMLAATALGAANPPLDAARLDIIHSAAWGRAEAARTVLRNCGDAAAPLVFGVLAESVFGGGSGLEWTFVMMLATLVAASIITLRFARRTYPGDVAAAAASMRELDG